MSRTPDQRSPTAKAKGPQAFSKADQDQHMPADGDTADDPRSAATKTASLQAQLAHELKTPISAIAAAADIMRNEQFGPLANDKYKTYAVDIYASAMFTLAVVDRMLNSGRMTPLAQSQQDVSDVDLTTLAREIASAMQPLAQASGITLSARDPSAPAKTNGISVRADAISVKQIATNLLANAIKFTASGGNVTLTVSETAIGGARIAVADDGAGMTKPQIASALSGEKVPAHKSTEQKRGLGMGLPLVRNLAAKSGADLVITSDGPGTGTRVEVRFPPERTNVR